MTFVFTFDTWWRIVVTDLRISSAYYKVFIRNVKRPAGFFRNCVIYITIPTVRELFKDAVIIMNSNY